MRIRDHCFLDFQDVLLVPQRSSLDSRASVELERTFRFKHTSRTITCCPIIGANLDTVGSFNMARALAKHKMLTAIHKHYSENELVEFFDDKDIWDFAFYTVGASTQSMQKLYSVMRRVGGDWPHLVCLDAANGYTQAFEDALVCLRNMVPEAVILAGNVATGNMTEELLLQGADIVKVGIGSGSLCETRIKTGIGVPQLSATDICAYQAHGLGGHVCSDGGITSVGDICKALGVGGDFVMLGGFLAGAEECDGEWLDEGLKAHGMSSRAAMVMWHGGVAPHRTSEGREVIVPCKGPVEALVQDIKGGVASCCTYIGCLKIKDMPKCAEFIRVRRQYNDLFVREK